MTRFLPVLTQERPEPLVSDCDPESDAESTAGAEGATDDVRRACAEACAGAGEVDAGVVWFAHPRARGGGEGEEGAETVNSGRAYVLIRPAGVYAPG